MCCPVLRVRCIGEGKAADFLARVLINKVTVVAASMCGQLCTHVPSALHPGAFGFALWCLRLCTTCLLQRYVYSTKIRKDSKFFSA